MEKLVKRIKEYKDFIESKRMEHCDDGIFIYYDDLQLIIDMYEKDKIIEETLNEQVKYIKIVSELAEFLTKAITIDYQKERHLANEDMDKGAAIAYQDIYNHLSEIMNDEPRDLDRGDK